MNIKVGSYEAKTKLPELLRGVQAGNHYTITLRGEAVAELVPAHFEKSPDKGAAVDDMLAFMKKRKTSASINLKALIKEVESQRFVALYAGLDIELDETTGVQALGDILQLARRFKLSAYDAAYLELSLRKGLPLSTLDAELATAAITAGVAIFGQP